MEMSCQRVPAMKGPANCKQRPDTELHREPVCSLQESRSIAHRDALHRVALSVPLFDKPSQSEGPGTKEKLKEQQLRAVCQSRSHSNSDAYDVAS